MIEPGTMMITIRTADWAISVREPNLIGGRWDPEAIGRLVARAVAMTLAPRLSHLAAAFAEFCLDHDPPGISPEIIAAERDFFGAAQRLIAIWQDHDNRLNAEDDGPTEEGSP